MEASSALGVLYLQQKGAVYVSPSVSSADYEIYLKTRDPVLGWPSPNRFNDGPSGFDKSGSRIIPSFPDPDPAPPYISVYGDSYTWGDEVDSAHAYPHVLATLVGKRVSNYGVGGYGTDQAYLRFLQNVHDPSKVVILGHTTENILRNVNRYRNLLYHSQILGLKPRFVLSPRGELELIPLPHDPYSEFIEMTKFPKKKLNFDYFVPDGPAGITQGKFPYTPMILKTLLRNFHIRARIAHVPWYKEFYETSHPSDALPVTVGILKQFHEKALSMGKYSLIVIIPTGLDFEYYARKKDWVYKNLLDRLREEKIEFIDAGPLMIKELKGEDPGIIFKKKDRSGHFNEKGYEMLARVVYGHLLGKKALP